jgi:excisionase family DNA binding protein
MSELPVIWCSVDEAIRISGISRSLLYDMMNDGRLKSAKVGKKRLVSVESIQTLGDAPPPEKTRRRLAAARHHVPSVSSARRVAS